MRDANGNKWFVVDVQQICIVDGAPDFMGAQAKADARVRKDKLPPKSLKVMTHPRVGTVTLDPKDPASYEPKRSANPARGSDPRVRVKAIESEVLSEYERESPLWAFDGDEDARAAFIRSLVVGKASESQIYSAWRQVQEGNNPKDVIRKVLGARRNPDSPQIPTRGTLWKLRSAGPARRDRVYEVIDANAREVTYKDAWNDDVARCPTERWHELMTQGPEQNPQKLYDVEEFAYDDIVGWAPRVFGLTEAEAKKWVAKGARTGEGRRRMKPARKSTYLMRQYADSIHVGDEMFYNDFAGKSGAFVVVEKEPKAGQEIADVRVTEVVGRFHHKVGDVFSVNVSNLYKDPFDAQVQLPGGGGAHIFYSEPRDNPRRLRSNPGELMIVNPTENPEADTAKAEKVFEMWHKKPAKNSRVERPRVNDGDMMVCVGNACDIVYRSGKWEKGTKTNDYIHKFDSKPKVWMLASVVPEDEVRSNASKTVGELLKSARNADGQYACADLATPISLSVDSEDNEIKISSGARVLGAIDRKTIIILDPKLKLVVIRGGEMHFDERGIIK